jgi:hypothetical protein
MSLVAQDAAHGALPTLYAATQDLPGGSYVGPDGRMGVKHSPKLETPPVAATDPKVARELWRQSAQLTHTEFTLASEADRV